MQAKEARNLIECGGLNGLGESRAAMLVESNAVAAAGNALQLRFDFAQESVTPESPTERLNWERRVLGLPVGVHPLETVPDPPGGDHAAGGVVEAAGRTLHDGRIQVARLDWR